MGSCGETRGVLLELAGTVCIGKQAVRGAVAAISHLRRKNIRILFLTNKSTRSPSTLASDLRSIGIDCRPSDILTSPMVAAHYLESGRVYCVGEEGLKSALRQGSLLLVHDAPDHVVVGLDRAINYEKITRAARFIREGAGFLATSRDGRVNTEDGISPAAGAIVAAVEAASSTQPISVGKPERPMFDMALEALSIPREEVIMVGDNLTSDILGGQRAGLRTALVTTGLTSVEDLRSSEIRPTWVLEDLSRLVDVLHHAPMASATTNRATSFP